MSYVPRLKDYPYYADLYDKFTVEKCRRFIAMGKNLADKNNPPDSEDLKDKALNQMNGVWTDVAIEFIKGDRYSQKEETIRKWMKRDEELDEYYNNARPPQDIACLSCGKLMYEIHKELDTSFDDKEVSVLYMFECPLKHLPRRAFYDNGKEYRPTDPKCKKCQSFTSSNSERNENSITTTYTCTSCGEIEKDVLDLTFKKTEEVIDKDFAKDRDEFCLTKEEGERYIMSTVHLQSNSFLNNEDNGNKKEYTKEIHDKVETLNKLTILELEELLNKKFEGTQFVRLQFKDPVSDREFYVPFVVYDANSKTNPNASEIDLAKIINKATKDTNWRLMSDGIHYRLGMLTGRLRAYEKEEDLLELVRVRNKK